MKKFITVLIATTITAFAQAGSLEGYEATISAPADSGSGPALWFKNTDSASGVHMLNSGSAGATASTHQAYRLAGVTSTDLFGNANQAFGIVTTEPTPAVAGSTGLFMTGQQGTISLLFKMPSTIDNASLFVQGGFELFALGSTDTLRLTTESGTYTTLGSLSTDTWYYFATRWNADQGAGADELTWYMGEAGGTLSSGSINIVGIDLGTSGSIQIAGRSTSSKFPGAMQEFAVYERELSDASIQTQFTAAIIPQPVPYVLVSGENNATAINALDGTLQMQAIWLPAGAAVAPVVWALDNPAVAGIDASGLLTAKSNGEVTVTALAKDGTGISGSAIITISENPVEEVFHRLSSRFKYRCTSSQCTFKNAANWANQVSMSSGAQYESTTVQNEYVQYSADIDQFSGDVEIMVYKNTSAFVHDDRVRVEVFHNGRSEFFYADFSSSRDAWYSLGTFYFTGDDTEYVRFHRDNMNPSGITPALPVRFDVYYDTQTRNQTAEEQGEVVPIGFSHSGIWQDSTNTGYRNLTTPQESSIAGASAVWNPGQMDAGKIQLYVFSPNVATDDTYEIFHNSKVDVVSLKSLRHSNQNLLWNDTTPLNPVVAQGWYKLGEYDFSGAGNEYVRLTKNTVETTFADCMMFESVKFDGTILHRTVVTTSAYSGGLYPGAYPASLEEKEQAVTSIPIGFSPNSEDHLGGSQYNGSTIYSRVHYVKRLSDNSYWNPLVVEPGDYELLYYVYYPMTQDGDFTVRSNGSDNRVTVDPSQYIQGQFTSIGTFTFAGGLTNEYIQMTGVKRVSDILLEKKIANNAILKQVVVTVHPYFHEMVYDDTTESEVRHEISFMVKEGYVFPVSSTHFSPNTSMTRAEFIQSVTLMAGLSPDADLPSYSDVNESDWFKGYIGAALHNGLLYGLHDVTNIYPDLAITREVAAQILLNAMEFSGRYTNVKNLFKTEPSVLLEPYADKDSISPFAVEAFARMLETGVMEPVSGNQLLPSRELTRAEAVVVLKEFLEGILGSGPHSRNTDWEYTFGDEFNGNQLDYSKWSSPDYVRFVGVSAKWRENCVVEDGVFKGYNFMDNHSVPYSSGNIASKFEQMYGFFEARYKYPDKAYGSHSSFWTGAGGNGDFNYNEGTYPNAISHNNYFMASQNMHNYNIPMNMAHDFHTIAGYLNDTDLYCGLDGQTTWDVPNYPAYYGAEKTTAVPYSFQLSTVISYFDGPLDRDRIDGSYVACDWVRIYREAVWIPEVDVGLCIPTHNATNQSIDILPVVKFNKAMDLSELTTTNLVVTEEGGSPVPAYTIQQMTPLRFGIRFNENLEPGKTYHICVKSAVKDLIGNTMGNDTLLSFSTTTKTPQTIHFNPLSSVQLATGSLSLAANSTSELGITFVSDNPDVTSISGNIASLLAVGATTITAQQPGDATYAAAPDVSRTLTVIDTIDGYPDLLKYATGSTGAQADTLARVTGVRNSTNGLFALQFNRNTNATDVVVVIEQTASLTNLVWQGIATNRFGSWSGATNVTESGEGTPVSVIVQELPPPTPSRFMHLRVTHP